MVSEIIERNIVWLRLIYSPVSHHLAFNSADSCHFVSITTFDWTSVESLSNHLWIVALLLRAADLCIQCVPIHMSHTTSWPARRASFSPYLYFRRSDDIINGTTIMNKSHDCYLLSQHVNMIKFLRYKKCRVTSCCWIWNHYGYIIMDLLHRNAIYCSVWRAQTCDAFGACSSSLINEYLWTLEL